MQFQTRTAIIHNYASIDGIHYSAVKNLLSQDCILSNHIIYIIIYIKNGIHDQIAPIWICSLLYPTSQSKGSAPSLSVNCAVDPTTYIFGQHPITAAIQYNCTLIS